MWDLRLFQIFDDAVLLLHRVSINPRPGEADDMSQDSLDSPTEWLLDWSEFPAALHGMDFAELIDVEISA